jgi:hypothetical protein
VAPVIGTMGSVMWDTYVATTDVQEAARQLEYRVEAGSTRRPNKEFESRTMTEMYQAVAPFLQTYAQATGDVQPLNNLVADLAKSRSLDPSRYVIKMAPQPPQPQLPPPGAEGAEPAGAEPAAEPAHAGNGRPR